MSSATEDAEGQWAEHVAEMASLYDGTDGLFGVKWAELATMQPSTVIVHALQETPEEQRAGFRGQMISTRDAENVIAEARKWVAAQPTPPKIVAAASEPATALTAFIGQELEKWGFDVRPDGKSLGIYVGEGRLLEVDVLGPRVL